MGLAAALVSQAYLFDLLCQLPAFAPSTFLLFFLLQRQDSTVGAKYTQEVVDKWKGVAGHVDGRNVVQLLQMYFGELQAGK